MLRDCVPGFCEYPCSVVSHFSRTSFFTGLSVLLLSFVERLSFLASLKTEGQFLSSEQRWYCAVIVGPFMPTCSSASPTFLKNVP